MSSNTQLLDSDLVNEWSELLNNEQELAASSTSSLPPPTHHHHHTYAHHTLQSHLQGQHQILENGCFIPPNHPSSFMKQKKSSSSCGNGIIVSTPPPCTPNHSHSNNTNGTIHGSTTTTSWIELKSSTKSKAPPIPMESMDTLKSKETIVHKSIRPAPAIPPNARRKFEEESSEGSPITKQPPPRSGSVSRGLQVEEEDLIQFSEPDMQFNIGYKSHPEDSFSVVHHRSSFNSGGRRRPPGRSDIPSHNNNSISPNHHLSNNNNNSNHVNEKKKLNGVIGVDALEENKEIGGGEDEMMDEFNNNNVEEEEDGDDNTSNRTADEQIDYLESLEPCPCYAKCCLDSIITLFCVTLLG